jgi:hypothetical protein
VATVLDNASARRAARVTGPKGPEAKRGSWPLTCRCVLLGRRDEIDEVIEFFPTRRQAEAMLAEAVWDELDWRGILHVERIELRTGTTN